MKPKPKIDNEQEAHVWATVYAAWCVTVDDVTPSAEASASKADEAVLRFRNRWQEGYQGATGET